MAYRIEAIPVTSMSYDTASLQIVIFRTAVQQLTRFQLTANRTVPMQ